MREKYVEQKLIQAVRRSGGLALKLVSPGFNGVPDRLLLFMEGKLAFCEVKAPGQKPRPLQVHRMDQLQKMGFKVFVIDDVEQIPKLVGEMIDAERVKGRRPQCGLRWNRSESCHMGTEGGLEGEALTHHVVRGSRGRRPAVRARNKASGGSLVRAGFSRNKRAPRWGVLPRAVRERRDCGFAVRARYQMPIEAADDRKAPLERSNDEIHSP